MKKVFVIGLDCAPPSIIFNRRKECPILSRLIENGTWGKMKSCHPPITIPAWMAMCTSKDAGDMGIYGFKHRKGNSYTEAPLTFSDSIDIPAIWDIIAKRDMSSCLVGIPPSYPPKKINGNLVSCFLTPDSERDYTYPKGLKDELEKRFGRYIFDVVFRTEERSRLLKDLYNMTRRHFEVIEYLIQNKPWQFFMFVEIGIDRINHAFWKFFDKRHHSYKPGNKYENVILDYYKFIDKEIEKLLKLLDDDTVVFIVSDHGAKPMKGAFCVNQWLIEKGYLTLKKTPKSGAELDDCDIDWANTKAWAWGGYYARIFLNIKGREKRGMILSSQYEAWRNRLKEELANVGGPDGEKWQTKVYKPEELFSNPKGEAADLLVYFDDLYWRAAGTIGYKSIYLPENDIGPDDAVHDWDGIFIMYNPTQKKERNLGRLSIYDFAPTVLDILGVEIPKDMKGKSIVKKEHIYV